jgi:hypothetical protein
VAGGGFVVAGADAVTLVAPGNAGAGPSPLWGFCVLHAPRANTTAQAIITRFHITAAG